jgi:hypothetical protein
MIVIVIPSSCFPPSRNIVTHEREFGWQRWLAL